MQRKNGPIEEAAKQLIDARLYASIVESSSDAIISKSLDGIIQSWNTAAERLFGYTAEQAIGRHISFIIPADRTDEEQRILSRLRAGERIEHYDTVRVSSDGRHVPVSLTISPVKDAEGQIVMASKIVRDITQRREIEQVRHRSEQSLADFFENANVCLHWVGPDGIILRANRAELKLLGYSAQEYIGKHVADFHADQSAIKTILARLTRGDTLYDYPARLRCKNGSIREVLITSSVLREEGEFIHTRCITRDITPQTRADAALLASEAKYRTLFDSMDEGYCVIEMIFNDTGLAVDYRFLEINAAFEKHTGMTGVLGKTVREFFPDLEGHWFDTYGRVVQTGESVRFIEEAKPMQRLFDVFAFRLGASGSDKVAILFNDVTVRQRAEQTLRASEERFRSLVTATSQIVWTTNADGVVVEDSPTWRAFTGQTVEQLLGRSGVHAIHSEDQEATVKSWQQALATTTPFKTEYRLRRHDGKYRWMMVRAVPVMDDAGVLQEWIGTNTDITEQKRGEKALRESEKHFRNLVDNIPQLAWIVEPGTEGKATWFNKVWLDFTGTTIEQMQGSGWKVVHHPDHLERVSKKFEYHVKHCLDWEDTFPLRGKDGEYRWFLSRMKCIRNESGTVVRILGTNTDITRERQMEERLRQLAAELSEAHHRKDEFLATLAHELRNPLAPIRHGLQLMKLANGQQTRIDQAHAMIERQIAQLVRLIDDLMDVSRISQGKLELRKERVLLTTVLNSAVETSRPLIEQMGHELTVMLPDQAIIVDADMTRLAQAFLNLLNNAAKYSSPGGRIQLKVDRDGSEAVIQVTDTGIGLSAEQLPRIFELFAQVDKSLEKSQGGLGIGLMLVKRLVEMHGGRIEATSGGLGKGSEFIVRLPLMIDDTLQPQALISSGEAAVSISSLRILVVDDYQDSADSLSQMLRLMGNDTLTAYDGQQGLDMAGEYRPELILLDIGMPKLNGYEVCRQIREQAWSKDVVMIALTGWGQDKDRNRTREAGFDHHLVKPVDAQHLLKMLNELPNRQHAD